MKKRYLLFLFILVALKSLYAQQPVDIEPVKLTHWLTPEEMLRLHEIGLGFVETPPPVSPVRNVAEFDRMQGALIRYPFGIPYSVIKEMAEDLTVMTIVTSASAQNTVLQLYVANGVDTSHCDFLIAPTNTYWTRDYGPWFESDTNNQIGIIDFPYNRPRPNDDEIPKKVANMLGIPWYGMKLTSTGGNYMTDGMGIAASTDLVWEENLTLTHDEVAQKAHDYLGIETYQVRTDLNPPEYIKHIDCWGKFLAPDKILLKKVPPSHPNYTLIEDEATYWAGQISSYGYPYKVYRVYTPTDQPYTNSIILNQKVLIPFMNSSWDDSAKAVYQTAMPGYEVIGFTALPPPDGWVSTDALHCRIMGISDIGLLYIRHVPLSGNQPCESDYQLQADILACSQHPIKSDSALVYYKVNNGTYQTATLLNTSGNHYTGVIPKQVAGSTIDYYLFAADESDRHATTPFIGAADPFRFTTTYTNLAPVPDTLFFITVEDAFLGKITQLHNYTSGTIELNYVQEIGNYWPWYVDSMSVSSLPFTMVSGDSVAIRVKVPLPVNQSPAMTYLIDTLNITSSVGSVRVIIMINSDLLTSIRETEQQAFLGLNYPNPFTVETSIPVTNGKPCAISLEIFDIRGMKIRTLISREYLTGSHIIHWDGCDDSGSQVKAGVYFYRMTTDNTVQTRRMILIR